jgi:polysaccharide biosynthesis transport protein
MSRPDSAPPRSVPASSFDLKTLWHLLLERFWIVLICLVLGVLAAIGIIQRSPVLYASTATVRIEPEEQRILKGVERVAPDDRGGLDALRTIEQSFKSRSLLERVATANELAKDPNFWASPGEPTLQQLSGALDNIVQARLRRGARFIDITVTHPNPEIAAKLANSVIREYLAQAYEQNTNAAADATSFLATEARRLKADLEKAEATLQQFRQQTKNVALEEKNDVINARMKELGARVTEANSHTIKLKSDLEQVQRLGTNVDALLVVAAVNSDASVVEARSTLSRLDSEFASLRQRYKSAHPRYVEKVNQIAEWRSNLTNAVLKVPQTIRASYDAAMSAQTALQLEFEKQQDLSRKLTDEVVQYQKLVRETESIRALHDAVQNRMKETMLTRELKPSKVFLTDSAMVDRKPVSPNKRSIMLKGVFGGIIIGVLIALGLNALDSSLKTVDQAEEYLHLPVLTSVPQLKLKAPLVVREEGNSPGAEAFRTLRTSLSMLGRAEHRRTFLFTSALPGEGKTFSSINYAASLAQQGLKTLLIDADLRRPSVQKTLLGHRDSIPGVTDYLTGRKRFEEVVQAHDENKLFFITAGTTAPNPAELLAQSGIEALIDEALLHYDRVVVDCAPIHAVSDTLMILGRIQTVCLVVRAGKTPRRAVARAVEMLYKAEASVGGVILNRQRSRGLTRYYYDSYYTYTYGGKYAEKGVYGAR